MKALWVLLVVTLLMSCGSTEKFSLSEDIDKDSLAVLHVYRTEVPSHRLNSDKPLIYLNNQVVAELDTGQTEVVQIPAGNHRLSVRQPVVFVPGTDSDTFEFEFEAGNTYYLRYDYSFGNANTVAASNVSSFHMTSKENYLARK